MTLRTEPPPATALPDLRQLNRATLLAAGVAVVILVTAVLPAEYGIDPTGAGRLLDLTRMGEMKRQQADGVASTAGAAGDSITSTPSGGTQVRIVLRPYGGREVKARMKAGAQMRYEWSTDGEAVEYEFHGDHDDGRSDHYSSYEKGTKASAKGTLKAAFDGRHGWYWHNLKPVPVTVTATVEGSVERFAPL
jgi:hypothetical protein